MKDIPRLKGVRKLKFVKMKDLSKITADRKSLAEGGGLDGPGGGGEEAAIAGGLEDSMAEGSTINSLERCIMCLWDVR